MLLIVLYHFLEVNAKVEPSPEAKKVNDTLAAQRGSKIGEKR